MVLLLFLIPSDMKLFFNKFFVKSVFFFFLFFFYVPFIYKKYIYKYGSVIYARAFTRTFLIKKKI